MVRCVLYGAIRVALHLYALMMVLMVMLCFMYMRCREGWMRATMCGLKVARKCSATREARCRSKPSRWGVKWRKTRDHNSARERECFAMYAAKHHIEHSLNANTFLSWLCSRIACTTHYSPIRIVCEHFPHVYEIYEPKPFTLFFS